MSLNITKLKRTLPKVRLYNLNPQPEKYKLFKLVKVEVLISSVKQRENGAKARNKKNAINCIFIGILKVRKMV